MNYKTKITCYTPKGQAEKASKSFGIKHFEYLKQPLETKIVSDSEFYYIYEYENIKDYNTLIDKKIPKAEMSIRKFYTMLIYLVERANKIAIKKAWQIEKAKGWLMRMLHKNGFNEREMSDFIDAINLEDKDEIIALLSKPLFNVEMEMVE